MKKETKCLGAMLLIFSMALTQIITPSATPVTTPVSVSAADFVVEKDPYIIPNDQAQSYNTNSLTLTKGLTYTKNGVEHEVKGAIDTQSFCADPTSMQVDGKIYVYGTRDQRSYQKNSSTTTNNREDGPIVANKYQTRKLSIFSTTDLVNWTDEGYIDMEALNVKWAGNSWAPSACKYDADGDGKDEYYIFFTNGGNIGYVKGETPTGPWKDELGKLLIDKDKIKPELDGVVWNFDPGVLVDDKGDAYIYWGGGTNTDKKHPKTSRACKLNFYEDRVELERSTITTLDSYYMFEDNEINQFQGKYVYTYCSNWDVPSNNKYINGSVSIVGYVSDDPLNITADPENYQEGDPKFIGTILTNPGSLLFDEYYNNHHQMFEFKGKYYMLYHTTALDQFLYKDFYSAEGKKSYSYRNLHLDEISVDVAGDNPSIKITPTYKGPDQVGNFNPYQTINATTQSMIGGISTKLLPNGSTVIDKIDTGDWTRIDGIDFGSNGATQLEASVASDTTEGSIEVYLDTALTGTKIATLNLKDTGADNYETLSANLANVTGVHDVYFVFRGVGYNVASWKFSEAMAIDPSPSPSPVSTPAPLSSPSPTPGPITPTPVPNVTAPAKTTSLVVKAAKSKKLRSSWKKVLSAKGYQVMIAQNRKFTKAMKVKTTKAVQYTFKSLKTKKTYYIKVRAYKLANGKKVYGKWSAVKKAKVTK